MKAIRSNRAISPHGGVVPILKRLKRLRIPQLICSCLNARVPQSKYGFEDVIIGWSLAVYCGGKRLENITRIKEKLAFIPELNIPSHDTVGRLMKKLATKPIIAQRVSATRDAKVTFTEYDDNIDMNRLLVKTTKAVGALKENRSYTLDIDSTFIPTFRKGAVRKKDEKGKVNWQQIGFYPMICLIEDLPVFISMRDGYTGSKFRFKECLESTLNLLDESKIRVGRVISDGAGYNKQAFEMLDERGIKFIVRFHHSEKKGLFNKKLKSWSEWRAAEIETTNNFWQCEIADIPYKLYDMPGEKESGTWRVVAVRIRLNKEQGDAQKKMHHLSQKGKLKDTGREYPNSGWKQMGDFAYKFYITNDFEASSVSIVKEYNGRGNAERKFNFMKEDFSWSKLPFFNSMSENTVFMITAALANNIFRAMVKAFKKHVPQLDLKARLSTFRKVLIDVACEYANGIFDFGSTSIAFEKIM